MPGPPPKRQAERMGHHKPVDITTVDISALAKQDVEIPQPPTKRDGEPAWHPIAEHWYTSLARSGQARFYEPSDWALAYVMAENLSRELKPQFVGMRQLGPDRTEPVLETIPMKGASLTAYLKGMTALMVAEGDRRRLKIELERPRDTAGDVPEGVADIAKARAERFH